jgi:DNA-binding phage protein
MAKIKICREEGCNNSATTEGYCRLHYLTNWKKIKSKKQRTAAERLNRYIEHIVKSHPNRYIDEIKRDIRSRNFEKDIAEEYGSDMDDIYKIFSDPGYDAEVEDLIRKLKIEDKF